MFSELICYCLFSGLTCYCLFSGLACIACSVGWSCYCLFSELVCHCLYPVSAPSGRRFSQCCLMISFPPRARVGMLLCYPDLSAIWFPLACALAWRSGLPSLSVVWVPPACALARLCGCLLPVVFCYLRGSHTFRPGPGGCACSHFGLLGRAASLSIVLIRLLSSVVVVLCRRSPRRLGSFPYALLELRRSVPPPLGACTWTPLV